MTAPFFDNPHQLFDCETEKFSNIQKIFNLAMADVITDIIKISGSNDVNFRIWLPNCASKEFI